MSTVSVVRRNSPLVRKGMQFYFDYWLALAILALLVIGMLMVYSTTFDYAFRFIDGDPTYFLRRQTWALVLGFIGIIVILQFDYQALRKVSLPFLALTLGALIVVMAAGQVSLGAKRGLSGGSYQPSEVAKLALIIYSAHWISSKGDRIKYLTYGLIPFGAIVGTVCIFIVFQPDLSTSVLIVSVCLTLFFIGGGDIKQLGGLSVLMGFLFFGFVNFLPHASARVDSWRVALRDPTQSSWHVQQSMIALSRGGWIGVGPGQSVQKFGPLPAAHTDSVFAVIGEEFGFVGCMVVIGLLVFVAWRGFHAARRARDNFGFLLATGITLWFSYQALVNLAVITAVIPFTGIPLPFISYGGSSLFVSLLGAGVLLNVSRDAALGRVPVPRRTAPRSVGQARPAPSLFETIRSIRGKEENPEKLEMRSERSRISMRRRNRGTRVPRTRRSE